MENIEKGELITTGKAKSLYSTNQDDYLVMHYRDDTSAFDGKKIESLEGKGTINNKFNAFIMEYLEKEGIRTHFEELLSETDSLVKKLEMAPVECVVRNVAAGSICKRLGLEEGIDLNPPTFEFFYKDDDLVDPMINTGLCMAGNTSEIRDQFVAQWKHLPAEYVILIYHYAQQPKESVIKNLKLFMEEVKPALDELTDYPEYRNVAE